MSFQQFSFLDSLFIAQYQTFSLIIGAYSGCSIFSKKNLSNSFLKQDNFNNLSKSFGMFWITIQWKTNVRIGHHPFPVFYYFLVMSIRKHRNKYLRNELFVLRQSSKLFGQTTCRYESNVSILSKISYRQSRFH